MSSLKPDDTEKTLRLKDKIFIGLGLTMAITALIILESEFAASPGLTLLTLIVGLYLILRGMKKLVSSIVSRMDKTLEGFFLYRGLRWILAKIFLALLLIIGFLLSCIGNAPTRRNNQTDSSSSLICDRGDDAWDDASDHYYDKEPPPPFS